MNYIYGHHKVVSFDNWKPYFDSDEQRRQEYGVTVEHLFRSADDPNDVHFIFRVNDVDRFMQCMQDPMLGNIMQQAGVLQQPAMSILSKA